MANQENANLTLQILANKAGQINGLKQSQNQLNGFVSAARGIAGAVGIAFGVREVLSFGTEIAKLAGQAEGVRAAFDRLPASQKVLEDLTAATHGTVSELELMKR